MLSLCPSLWCFPSFPFPFLSLLSGVLLGTVLGFLSGVYLLTSFRHYQEEIVIAALQSAVAAESSSLCLSLWFWRWVSLMVSDT